MRDEVFLGLEDLVGRSEHELNEMMTASAAKNPNEFRSDMVPPCIWRLAKQTLCQTWGKLESQVSCFVRHSKSSLRLLGFRLE